ncbi:hypothetical protein LG275_07885 [Chryseomicrobium palamuruense]
MKKIILKLVVVFATFFITWTLMNTQPVQSWWMKTIFELSLGDEKEQLETFQYDHVTIYTDQPERIMELFEPNLDEIDQLSSAWFEPASKDYPEVTMYAIEPNLVMNIMLKGANGIYIPSSEIMLLNMNLDDDRILHGYAHEYAHYRIFNYLEELDVSYKKVPMWFHEGVAEAFSHRFAPLPFAEVMNEWEVDAFFEKETTDRLTSDEYIMSQFLVEYLLYTKEDEAVHTVLSNLTRSSDFETVLEEQLNYTYTDLKTYLAAEDDTVEDFMYRTEAEVGNEQFQAEVLAFHERKKPYYYNAQLVTNILSQMYQTDEKWLEMAELTEYRMNYVQRDSIDYQLAAGYAKKAGDLGKEAYYLVKAEEEKAKEEPVQE